jgi:hypothetical protein
VKQGILGATFSTNRRLEALKRPSIMASTCPGDACSAFLLGIDAGGELKRVRAGLWEAGEESDLRCIPGDAA